MVVAAHFVPEKKKTLRCSLKWAAPERWAEEVIEFLKGSLLFTLKTLQIYKQVNIKCTLANIHTHLLLWRCRLTATWPWPCGRVLFGVSMFSSLFLPVYVYVCVCVVIGCWPAPPGAPCLPQNAWWDGLEFPCDPEKDKQCRYWTDGWIFAHA